ncbi:(4Fe-4S)-binding protein [Bacillus sp. FJAT-49732]|uniref:(4Fe-4S)-binding protein n=1 Tax=Lederbergia citrisecunda TaxID=2833583 RepID=A0A942TQ39_9BACI|nr:(4Fe-4S)-binding protein [Lederbergia citrisecunda]MBS4200002.1 (4Fe-4S)-binding protein [Lederbergia citrisecunda]
MENDYKLYSGKDIEVKFYAKRCLHAAQCVKGLSEVFDVKKRPWVNPDQASADDVARVIERCPSGALEYVRKDGEDQEQPQAETTLDLQPGHVMYIRGNVTIKNGNETIQCNRAALCGCGHSNNKPFCDNSHECRP